MLKLIAITALLMVVSSAHPSIQIVQSLEPVNELLSTLSSQPISNGQNDHDANNEIQSSLDGGKDVSNDTVIRSSSDSGANLNELELASILNEKATQFNIHSISPKIVEHPTVLLTGIQTVYAPETIRIHQPTVVKVGDYLQRVPTSVSHQSQTVVHNHAEVKTPIVAPALRTVTSQSVRAYQTPILYTISNPSNQW